jgi:hypothetical protein
MACQIKKIGYLGVLPQFIALKEVRHIIVGWNAGVSLYV